MQPASSWLMSSLLGQWSWLRARRPPAWMPPAHSSSELSQPHSRSREPAPCSRTPLPRDTAPTKLAGCSGGAEWLALAFAALAPLGLAARPSRLALGLAAIAGLVTFAALLANGSTTKILLLWNEGLAGTLPSVAYAVGAAALLATALGLLRQRRLVVLAGFVLLITGGIGLHSTYQTGLVVAGMVALCIGAREAPRTALGTARAAQEPSAPGRPLASSS